MKEIIKEELNTYNRRKAQKRGGGDGRNEWNCIIRYKGKA